MAPLYDEEARSPLVNDGGNYSSNSPSSSSAEKTGSNIMLNRILILVTLTAFVITSVVFQMNHNLLTQQLAVDEATIQQLSTTVHDQGEIIQRFNESVTNSDVLKELKDLKASLGQTQGDLNARMDATVQQVNQTLSQTMQEMDTTVKKAEDEISHQVEVVQKNFEQYAVATDAQFSMENSFMVYQIAGTFTLLSCLISMWHMTAHLRKLRQPVIQRKILAILWMSPVYAITSWFSLVFPAAEGYLAIVKDGYEAYIIYQFLSFCIAVMGKGDRNVVVDILARRADHLTPPFRLFFCCRPDPYENNHQLADAILLQCQFFAMQFVFFRPVTTIAKVVLAKYQYYGPWGAEGPDDYRAPQFYVSLIQNLSIFTAFAGLLKFYHAVDEDLQWCRPFAKFLCIKGVVFMTFWQGLAISILAEVTEVGGNDSQEWAASAQNFLICLEMLLFSIAHFHCFPTEEWDENYRANFNKSKFGDSIALGDFFADIKLLIKGQAKRKKKRKSTATPPTVPEGDEENGDDEGDDNGDEENGAKGSDEDEDETEAEDSTHDDASEISELTGDLGDNGDLEAASKRAVAHALAKSDDGDSPEMEEARQRILQSGFLDDMLFMAPELRTPRSALEETWATPSKASSTPSAEPKVSISYGATDDDANDPETPSEKTSLLWGGESPVKQEPSPSTALRPSIFTAMAAISETNEDATTPKKEESST
eukprot:Nitzschia sp. Nitz4//scaffold46_size129759//67957//70162//NITZ4_003506-RA/size129759-augustus-gene-0.9-mRNA-1//1//CDS//3329552610//4102//frame0